MTEARVIWLIIIGGTIGTFALRYSFIGAAGVMDSLPDAVTRSLRFLPAAVLAALAVPAVIAPEGAVVLEIQNERLLAGIVAVGVAARTKSVFWTIAVGMSVFWILR